MRRLVWMGLLLMAVPAVAQDPGMQAAQMASDAAMQAAQTANQMAMQASQAAQTANEQAMWAAQANSYSGCSTPAPQIKVIGTNPDGSQTVLLADKWPHTAIFYTTDGWTPDWNSSRFGPLLTMNTNGLLQAVAYSPGCGVSGVAEMSFAMPGKDVPPPVTVADGVLHAGTAIPLRLSPGLNTKTLKVGQILDVTNAAAFEIDGRSVPVGAAHGFAVATDSERGGLFGSPGVIALSVQSLTVDGKVVALRGNKVAEIEPFADLQYRNLQSRKGSVGQHIVEAKGRDLVVAPGASLMAVVAADTRFAAN